MASGSKLSISGIVSRLRTFFQRCFKPIYLTLDLKRVMVYLIPNCSMYSW